MIWRRQLAEDVEHDRFNLGLIEEGPARVGSRGESLPDTRIGTVPGPFRGVDFHMGPFLLTARPVKGEEAAMGDSVILGETADGPGGGGRLRRALPIGDGGPAFQHAVRPAGRGAGRCGPPRFLHPRLRRRRGKPVPTDVPDFYYPEATKVLLGLLPYRDFTSSYAPLFDYAGAAMIWAWNDTRVYVLAAMAFDLVSVPSGWPWAGGCSPRTSSGPR